MVEEQVKSRSASSIPPFRAWPIVQLTVHFFAGFRRNSWRRSAQAQIDEELGHVDEIAGAFPQFSVDSERVKGMLNRMQVVREEQEKVRRLSNRIASLMALGAFVTAPFLSVRVLHTSGVDADFFLVYWMEVVFFMFLALLPNRTRKTGSVRDTVDAVRSSFFSSGYTAVITSGVIASGYVALGWFVYRSWSGRPEARSAAILLAALSASAMLVTILFGWAFVTTAGRESMRRRWDASHPDIVVVSCLTDTLYLLSLNREEALTAVGGRLRFTRLLWQYLDRSTGAVESDLPSLLGQPDAVTSLTQREVLDIAAGLQDLKNDVARILSRNGAAEDKALGGLVQALNAWADGGVTELPRGKAEPFRERPHQKAVILRRLVAAVAPLLALALLRMPAFKSSPELTGALSTFSVLWLISTLLRMLLGEDYDKNLEATKGLAEVGKATKT